MLGSARSLCISSVVPVFLLSEEYGQTYTFDKLSPSKKAFFRFMTHINHDELTEFDRI
jgi:hypothetical protein